MVLTSSSGLKKIATGRSAEIFLSDEQHVLKLFHQSTPRGWVVMEGALTKRVLRMTQHLDAFHVPNVILLDEPLIVDGRWGLLYDNFNGAPLFSLDTHPSTADCVAIGRMLAELHLAVHRVPVVDIAHEGDPSSAPSQVTTPHKQLSMSLPDQQRRFFTLLLNSPALDEATRRTALAALERLPSGCSVLCHGDFHPINILIHEDKGIAVIDWVTASKGDPIADVANTVATLLCVTVQPDGLLSAQDSRVRADICKAYVRRYFSATNRRHERRYLRAWVALAATVRIACGSMPNELGRLRPLARKLARALTVLDRIGRSHGNS